MKLQRLLITLTIINVALLMFFLAQTRPAVTQDIAPILRGHALEIVDDRGRVRASIAVYPAHPNVKMPDGTVGYPETVLFRLITSKGRPNVKIAATEKGSAAVFGSESDPTYVQVLAEGASTSVKLVNKDGKQKLMEP